MSTWTSVSPYSSKPQDHVHDGSCWKTFYSCAMERIAVLERRIEKLKDLGRDAVHLRDYLELANVARRFTIPHNAIMQPIGYTDLVGALARIDAHATEAT